MTKAGVARKSSVASRGWGLNRRARMSALKAAIKRKNNVNGVERNFGNVFDRGEQQRQEPGVERRMRLAAHIDVAAHEHIVGVLRMERLDLRMGGLGEIQDIVALDRLIEERQAQSEHD